MRQKKLLLLLPIVVILFWLLVRWSAYHSSDYRFARNKIETSPAVQMQVGKVVDVSFPLLSRYSAHYGMGYSNVQMELTAKGEKGSARLDMDLTEADGVWKIKRSSINGRPVVLD